MYKMEAKILNAKGNGKMDYDYANDILFFKIKGREYERSLELEDLVLDIDKEGYITGIQIFAASKMFDVKKDVLRNVQKWEFKVRTEENVVFVNLMFEMIRRNKIVERGQNLVRELPSLLANSEVMCVATV